MWLVTWVSGFGDFAASAKAIPVPLVVWYHLVAEVCSGLLGEKNYFW
jgi:hypothetical protein